ncbi:unnamed protein product [[Actinomadura] parvosata subsp. kistnae]|nr:unnamed protein product [Actinomadura parvosata subsp. kistnae]
MLGLRCAAQRGSRGSRCGRSVHGLSGYQTTPLTCLNGMT